MKPQVIRLPSLVVALFLVSSSAWAGESRLAAYLRPVTVKPLPALACTDLATELASAADERGIPINQEQLVTTTSESITFAGTSIAGFEQVSAAEFPYGVDVGFVYIDAPELDLPAGFYTLNAHANEEDIRVGTYEGTVGLIDQEGQEVARVAATFETSSITVPEPLPFERTQVEVRTEIEDGQGLRIHRRLIIIIRCPNGTIIIIIIGRNR
ncbi:hypothetical protein ACLESO_51025 [Pyxidicoccus sp. 3LG]